MTGHNSPERTNIERHQQLTQTGHRRIDEYNDLAKQLGYEETLALESHSTNPADAH